MNDELQAKARELEELFAAHKLAAAAASSRRGRAREKATAAEDGSSGGGGATEKRVFRMSERGEFYERYMKKRDEKLREEWDSKMAEMKVLQRRLEEREAELKLRCFSIGSSVARKEEQIAEFEKNEEEENQEMYRKIARSGKESHSGPLFIESSSKASNSKKFSSSRSVSSFTRSPPVSTIPRPPSKLATSASARQRSHHESRKENTKPPTAISKGTRSNNLVRSKSIGEEINTFNQHRRSQSLGKAFENSDNSNTKPLALSKLKNCEPKPFLKKGNGIGPGSGAVVSKLRTSIAAENLQNGEVPKDISKDDSDNENPRLIQESSSSGDYRSEDDQIAMSLDTGDCYCDSDNEKPRLSLIATSSAGLSLKTSDIDASMDSPRCDLAQPNSSQEYQAIEEDAARVRKKWGSPHVPVIGTKGFKRFLKFGRKNKNTDSPATDTLSLSASSEFDSIDLSRYSFDDTSDSNSIQSVPPYDAKSRNSSVPDSPARHSAVTSPRASRSFFSFSSSKNKGSESKPRGI